MKILCAEIVCLLLGLSVATTIEEDLPWFKLGGQNNPADHDIRLLENAKNNINMNENRLQERTMDDLLRHRQRRKLAQQRSLEEDPDDLLSHDIVTVECTESPMYMCDVPADCRVKVLAQQEHVVANIQAQFPESKIVGSTHKLVNAIYVKLPPDSISTVQSIEGVKRIMPHEMYKLDLEDTVEHIGATAARQDFCATGKGVTVAVLDSGVDYTHTLIGGTGLARDYKRAYRRPRDRDGLFPTDRVIQGYDFVGHNPEEGTEQDDDPIDIPGGHGTLVSSTVLAVAPDAKLVAVRVCGKMCPEMSIVQGLEFVLDPNQDGDMEDRVDIVNMSLGTFFLASFDSAKSVAVENAFELGVLTVMSAGNHANRPYIIGPIASSPNGMAVGATGHPTNNLGARETMEIYSSRGPGENNAIKPDICAPSGSSAALASTGTETKSARGTSFSAPLVAGAAALVKERCPSCSPLAIKALLMNNAFRNVSYGEPQFLAQFASKNAPVTLAGSGELRIHDSLDANFWAYSPDNGDVQPSLSLGLVSAAANTTIQRTVKILSLVNTTEELFITTAFRDPTDAASGAVTISVNQPNVVLGGCDQEITVTINFQIDASKAPSNHMGEGGDPTIPQFIGLDMNEFDGHVIITSSTSGKEIALPFHLILRKAAQTTLSTLSLPWQKGVASSTVVQVQNVGAGTAQLEAFDLIAVSPDAPEGDRGEDPLGDIRSIGFRTLDVGEPGCTFVLEFLFNTWESHDRLNTQLTLVRLSGDVDEGVDYFVYNPPGLEQDIQVRKGSLRGEAICTGMPPDTTYNSRNVLLRVCSEDVGSPTVFDADFVVSIAPAALNQGDFISVPSIRVNQSAFSAPSYNIGPGQTLGLTVTGSGAARGFFQFDAPLGLQLITNGFRSAGNTGSATPETETHLLVVDSDTLKPEVTPDEGKKFRDAQDQAGPKCLWEEDACLFPTASPTVTGAPVPSASPTRTAQPTFSPEPTLAPTLKPSIPPSCPPNEIPRAPISSWSPSSSPSFHPTAEPTTTPYPTTTFSPTNFPTVSPTNVPTSTTVSPTNVPTSTTVSPTSAFAPTITTSAAVIACPSAAFLFIAVVLAACASL